MNGQIAPPAARRRRASVYLAGPIDRANEAEATVYATYLSDREQLKCLLVQAGFAVYAPHRAWSGVNLGRDECSAVEAANAAALAACDCVVAMLPQGVATVGTYAEIEQAAGQGKPVAVVVGSGRLLPPGVLSVNTVTGAVNTARQWRGSGELNRPVDTDRVARDVSVAQSESTAVPSSSSVPLPVLPLAGSQFLPMRHYDDDAGFDLFVTEQRTVMPGEFVDVPAGVRIEVPSHLWALILGRSSTMRKRGLMVLPGVIDSGWRGDWFAGVTNVGDHPVTVAVGERLAQFVLLPNLTSQYAPVVTEALSPHPRGANGFGSTGGHAEAPETLVDRIARSGRPPDPVEVRPAAIYEDR